jgi:hypothetical protein
MPPDEKDEPIMKVQPQGKPINEQAEVVKRHPVGDSFQGAMDRKPAPKPAPPAPPAKKKD